ncbi:MAG: hypothetical protein CMJ83_16345 [Planctomycetes bacterium]|nr:hypothetical protein [Planctomycetota bacterium]
MGVEVAAVAAGTDRKKTRDLSRTLLRMMRALLLVAVLLLQGCSMSDEPDPPSPPTAGPAAGIDLELARERERRVREVQYALSFDLQKGMASVAGTIELTFELADADADLVLDFDGEELRDLRINGTEVTPRQIENHVILPAARLKKGLNILGARFRSRVAATGTPLTVYKDASDGAEYLYTLVVPADAHRLFPCFDQPGLKGRFRLELTTPPDWVAVGNGKETVAHTADGRKRWTYLTTPPLPTYLFAFAAGPFTIVTDATPPTPESGLTDSMRLFVRASKLERMDRDALFGLHRRSVDVEEEYFGYPYPFKKLDSVLCPGFPYGGMEHAGAIFYRESALVFDHDPTELELLRRSSLIYHEVSHQWFGNLVTMRWFDDLWLKEGFATFVGYRVLDQLEPERKAWMRFHQRVKPSAFRIDVTDGTTPIWQKLQNLADAKSAYGPIVYNKAPAVLRELENRLGADAFRNGVRAFLKRFEFRNATWRDLLENLASASGEDLGPWSERWILDRGMPRISVEIEEDGQGRIARARLVQTDVLGEDRSWPLRLNVLVGFADGSRKIVSVTCDDASADIAELQGQPTPAFVLPNPDGVCYGQVVLKDARSRGHFSSQLGAESDPMVKAAAFSALWDTVKIGLHPPARFADTCLQLLETERDPQTHASLASALLTTLRRYLPPEQAAGRRRRTAGVLTQLLGEPWAASIRLQVLRRLAGVSNDDDSLRLLEGILDGKVEVPDLALGSRDRFLLVAALLANQRDGALARLEQLEQGGQDLARWTYLARAAIPTPENKATYWSTYLELETPPEQWVQGSLGYFHWPNQESLTLPYLKRALDQAEWVKQNRKIFFMPAWLEAFLGAHSSKEALDIVDTWLREHPDLPPDIRRKLDVPLHELRRAVRIRTAGSASR